MTVGSAKLSANPCEIGFVYVADAECEEAAVLARADAAAALPDEPPSVDRLRLTAVTEMAATASARRNTIRSPSM